MCYLQALKSLFPNSAPTTQSSSKSKLMAKTTSRPFLIESRALTGSVLCKPDCYRLLSPEWLIWCSRYVSSQSYLDIRIRKAQKLKLIQRSPYTRLKLEMKDIRLDGTDEHLLQGLMPVRSIYGVSLLICLPCLDNSSHTRMTLIFGESAEVCFKITCVDVNLTRNFGCSFTLY